jgi:GNAT superfamily N-acetyltransferase
MTTESAAVRFRPATAADVPGAYKVFRRSLADYLERIGMGDPSMVEDSAIATAWASQRPWMEHLVTTAGEHWIAIDDRDAIVGWALSVETDGLLELAMFFVDPGVQARGIGRGLLELAFPTGRGRHRAIIATLDPRALGLYLRFGVSNQTIAADFVVRPRPSELETDLDIVRLHPGGDGPEAIAAIEFALTAHRRPKDHAFLAELRPSWVARRAGDPVGFAYGVTPGGYSAGPIAALEARDLPALLTVVENDAAAQMTEEFAFTVPLSATVAVDHLLSRSAKIDPFYILILADGPWLKADRWILTGPGFVI